MKCINCDEEEDLEYFKVKWEDYEGNFHENKVLCSICADEIWNAMEKITLEIIRLKENERK